MGEMYQQCTNYEKTALFHLARTGILPATYPGMLELLEKGLVLRDPAPRLMSQSFRQFVLSQESRNCTGSLFFHCTIGPHVF